MYVFVKTLGASSARVAIALIIYLGATFHARNAAGQSATTSHANRSPAQSEMTPATVHARARLSCHLSPKGNARSDGIPVYTDDDGYARFYAMKLKTNSELRHQLLSCIDEKGIQSVFAVDLASDDIFAPHPLPISGERGRARPSLRGDPFAQSDLELIQSGYGIRPNPADDPWAYLSWLTAASTPGRTLLAKRTDHLKHQPIVLQAPFWTGSVLTGAPNYLSIQGMLNVPTAIAGGDQTTYTITSIWNGLGGFGTGSGLIQSGIDLFTSPTSASYLSFREYCCGDPNSNGYGGGFAPNPGDVIYVQNWYCDGQGRVSLNGGYGCSFLHDLTSSVILNCSSASGSPCWSVRALPLCSTNPGTPNCMTLGQSAEFIAENASPQATPPTTAFTDFTPTVRLTGSARSSGVFVLDPANRYSQTIGSDPAVYMLTDFTNTTTRLQITLGPRDSTCFTVHARATGRSIGWPKVDCPSTPLPSGHVPIDPSRRDEISAVILYGVIQDGGGIYHLGKTLKRVPPRGPLKETLEALPADLQVRLSPLLRQLPENGEAVNRLTTQLSAVISGYRQEKLLQQRQP
jgi:hypothetical protein